MSNDLKGRSRAAMLTLLCAALAASGCSNLGAKPWERDILSRDEMKFDSNVVDSQLDEHVYFSKEASSGGRGFGGGGCGCN